MGTASPVDGGGCTGTGVPSRSTSFQLAVISRSMPRLNSLTEQEHAPHRNAAALAMLSALMPFPIIGSTARPRPKTGNTIGTCLLTSPSSLCNSMAASNFSAGSSRDTRSTVNPMRSGRSDRSSSSRGSPVFRRASAIAQPAAEALSRVCSIPRATTRQRHRPAACRRSPEGPRRRLAHGAGAVRCRANRRVDQRPNDSALAGPAQTSRFALRIAHHHPGQRWV